MQVFPLTGIDKRYDGPMRTYLNYKARGHECEYLPNGVPSALALAGPKEAYSAMLSRKDLVAIGPKALYPSLHRTAHITKLVEIPMEQKDLLLHHHGLSKHGENLPDLAANKVADNRTRIVRSVAYWTGLVPANGGDCWTAFTSVVYTRRSVPQAYPEETVD